MDLLEYQMKEWFHQIGIPVLPSQRIDHPTDLKQLKISYPIVLKSQVSRTDREKVGGVKIVETTIDAIAAAQNMFNLPIWGELPEVLLAESKYNSQAELYLAVVLDTALCRPVLLGGKEPNSYEDSKRENMSYVVVEKECSPFYARRLGWKMGLKGTLMQSIGDIVEKMYHLFIQKDLDFVEINPLAIHSSGQVMALNGRVRINERAINRHPEIANLAHKVANRDYKNQINTTFDNWDSLDMLGKIGILGYGMGSVLAMLDLIVDSGGTPGACLNLRHSLATDVHPSSFCERLERGLHILATQKNMQVILINFVGNVPQIGQIPEAIAKFIQSQRSESKQENKTKRDACFPRLIVRLMGAEFNPAKKYLATIKAPNEALTLVDDLDEAVAETIRLAKLPILKK